MTFSSGQLAQTSLITQVGGAITSGIGSYYSAAAQKTALNAQAGLADTNARIAELGAQSAMNQGQQQIAALTLKAGQIKSSQKASMAANGINLGEGSAAEVQASTDIMKEIDKNTLEANAVRSAWGYRTNAVSSQNEALMKRASASSIDPSSAATSSLLGGAGQVASSWYKFKKEGAI